MRQLVLTFLVALLAVVSQGAFAQSNQNPIVVRGYVQTATGVRLPCLSVQLEPGGARYDLTQEGEFRIMLGAPGSFTLQAMSGTTVMGSLPVSVNESNREPLVLVVEQPYFCGEGAELTAQRAHQVRAQVPEVQDNIILASKKVELINLQQTGANLATNNSREAFSRVPGLQVWENDASGLQINVSTRGLSPNRSWEFNVRQNGYDISSDPLGYPESYYNPPLEAVRQAQFIRGAASLQFGPQFGGVLNYLVGETSNKPLTVRTQQTVGSYGLFSSFNSLAGRVGKLSYYAYYNHRSGQGWRANSRYEMQSSYARLNYAFTSKLNLAAEITQYSYISQQPGGLTDAQFASDPRQSGRSRNWFSTPTTIPALTLDWQVADRTHVSIKGFAMYGQRNSVGFQGAVTVRDTINATTRDYNPRQIDRDYYRNYGVEARVRHTYKLLSADHDLAAGLRYYNGHTDRNQLGRGTTGRDYDMAVTRYGRMLDLTAENSAAFAENIFRIKKRLTITPGVRFENINMTTGGNADLTGAPFAALPAQSRTRQVFLYGVGSEFKVTDQVSLYTNYAQAYRPMLFSNLTPGATTDIIDADLKDSKGYNLDLGVRGSVASELLSFDVSIFELKYDNRIGTLRQGSANFITNVGGSTSRGVEAYVELNVLKPIAQNIGSLTPFASVSFIDAKYDGFRQIVSGTETNLEGKRVQDAPQYIHRLGATYAFRGLRVNYTHSIVGAVYSDALNTEAPSANGQVGKIPAYNVADLSVQVNFLQHYNVRVGANNLYNRKYFTRRAGGYPGPGLLPNEARTLYISAGARF